ncbi:LysR family transcriptional regulator [Saccharibacillus sp. CPCC 101409]|uniref:LysR family transcriptional regulator n=1 Tax=Saccharibacillus sp. CPCC 101409 TaxID=3058041 RepID=UPI002672DA61|nr:LysR family transcriptional regulator [Saccharibacillus sp. CPCC 101409]MDO3412532.1 LysR family transcriptional regulator [Saccharibacillus sp. CPCC 101409]
MTLQQLRYAIEVAGCGSINEAAKRLFISQPSLSNAIKDLEHELGITIFDRTNRGITLSADGVEFMAYARQIVEQAELLESRYKNKTRSTVHFSVSTQHYAFASEAFAALMEQSDQDAYTFSLRETQTFDIIEDVRTMRSDLGILYLCDRNARVMNKLFSDGSLKFTPLFNTQPHIFIGASHPLAGREIVRVDDLPAYPYMTFDQGENSSLHFSEEMLNLSEMNRNVKVNDRATLLNLLAGTNGYTVGTGILASGLGGGRLTSVPVETGELFTIGWIAHKDRRPSPIASAYIELLNDLVARTYFDANQFLF